MDIALQHLREQGTVRSGQRVLINGAAGGVASSRCGSGGLGAHVTGVNAPDRQDLLRSLGAEAIDYTQQDFTRTGPYNVVIDIRRTARSRRSARALAPTAGTC